MIERNGVRGRIDGDNASLDRETALSNGWFPGFAAEYAQQQQDRKKNAYAQGEPPQTV
jgi:hypothetical protein